MAIRRSTPIRKRPVEPSGESGLYAAVVGAEDVNSRVDVASTAGEDLRAGFLERIRLELSDQHMLDAGEIDELMAHFHSAVMSAPLEPATSTLDVSRWIEVLEELAAANTQAGVDDDDHNALLRQIGELRTSFDNPELQIALEYSRRLQADGEAEASAWLARRRAEQGDASVAEQAGDHGAASVIPQSIVRSRSRRLRGPPVV